LFGELNFFVVTAGGDDAAGANVEPNRGSGLRVVAWH
jgi:hypothetical protein